MSEYPFRDNLRKAIADSGYVVKEVAKISKVAKGTIDNWLAEAPGVPTTPKVTDAYKVANALGETVEYLVTGESAAGWKPPERIAKIVDYLMKLDDNGLESVAILAKGLVSRVADQRQASGDG